MILATGGYYIALRSIMLKSMSFICLAILLLFSNCAISSSTVWLKDNFGSVCRNNLSSNPGQVIGYGGHDGSGNFIMTISNPTDGVMTPSSGRCLDIPKSGTSTSPTPIIFNGPTTLFRSQTIHMIKPGTGGALECLKQGINLVGLQTSIAGITSTDGLYQLTFGYRRTDGCDPNTGTAITSNGQPQFIRTSGIAGGPKYFSGNYYIYDSNAIPEPNIISIFLTGLLLLISVQILYKCKRQGT